MRGLFTVYNKVRKCIDSSNTLDHINVSENMIKNFVQMYDMDFKFENRLMRFLLLRREEILDRIGNVDD